MYSNGRFVDRDIMMWYHGGGIGHLREPETSPADELDAEYQAETDDDAPEHMSDLEQTSNELEHTSPEMNVDNLEDDEDQETMETDEDIEYESEEDMEPLQYDY